MNRAENPIRVPRKVALALVGSLILPIAACNDNEGATTTTSTLPESPNPIVSESDQTIIDQQAEMIKLLGDLILAHQPDENPEPDLDDPEAPDLEQGSELNDESASEDSSESILDQAYENAAEGEDGVFQLMDSDNGIHEVDLSGAIGFTPDADLRLSDIQPAELNPIPADAADFQAYLNTARDGFGPLAGFTDGTNDYNQYKDHESGPQVPAYSWMVHTGLMVEIPGIGKVVGGDSRAVMVLILNRTDDVHRFETNSVKVIAGFQGWGRGWNFDDDPTAETEKRLVNHYRVRLGQGVPETGFIGQCDEGAENCNEVTVVAVERMQWGVNEDGSPRYQFRLIRAETISTEG